MANFSKIFNEHLSTVNYCEIVHKGLSCKQHMLRSHLYSTLSTFKFLIPALLLPVIPKIPILTKEKLKQLLWDYISCSIGCSLVAAVGVDLCCLMRILLGRNYLYTMCFLPAFFGAFFVHLIKQPVFQVTLNYMYQGVVDIFLRRNNVVSKTISSSKSIQTIIFMLCSTLILHGKRLYGMRGFWLITPNRPNTAEDNDIENSKKHCNLHSNISCGNYLWKGVRKYFFAGLTLDCLSAIRKAALLKTKWNGIKKFRMYWAMKFSLYHGLYTSTHCFLNRINAAPDMINHTLASCCAGLSYYFFPQIGLLSYAIVLGFEALWEMFRDHKAVTKFYILKICINFFYNFLLFPLACGYSSHVYVMQPRFCSPVGVFILNQASNNYIAKISNLVQQIIKDVKHLNKD
uniref:Transmembrane protein 135 N-terminal domain-containing protein n=1 Tax=Glossina brevipalpis TaxID=37001 RepID=A0A1A9W1P7_9MUSC